MNIHIRRAAEIMASGGVIAYPTEAVWGLGCDPLNEQAVQRLLSLKSRPVEKGLILITGQMAHFNSVFADLPESQVEKLTSTWPGPTTWLVPDQWHIPEWVKGEFTSVALRVTNHPLVAALTEQFGGPIISTSANPTTKPPAISKLRVHQYFGDELDYIVPGKLGGLDKPSKIIDLATDRILRS